MQGDPELLARVSLLIVDDMLLGTASVVVLGRRLLEQLADLRSLAAAGLQARVQRLPAGEKPLQEVLSRIRAGRYWADISTHRAINSVKGMLQRSCKDAGAPPTCFNVRPWM